MAHGPKQPADLSLDQKLSVLRRCPGLALLTDAQLTPLAERMRAERIAQWMLEDEPLAERPLRVLYRGTVLLTQTDRLEALTRPIRPVALLGTEGLEHWWCEGDPTPESARIPKFAFRTATVVECLTLDRTGDGIGDPFDTLCDPADPACAPLLAALHMAYHLQVAAPDIVAALRTATELAGARQSLLYALALAGSPMVLHAGESLPSPKAPPGNQPLPPTQRTIYTVISGQVKAAEGDGATQVVRRGTIGFTEAIVGVPSPPITAVRDSQLVAIPWTRMLQLAERDPRVQRMARALGALDEQQIPPDRRWRFSGQDRVLLLDAPGGPPTSSRLALLVARQLAADINKDIVLIDIVPADRFGDRLEVGEITPEDGVGGIVHVLKGSVSAGGVMLPTFPANVEAGVVLTNAMSVRDPVERSRLLENNDYTTIAWFFEEGPQWEDLPFDLASHPSRLLPVDLLPFPRRNFPLIRGLLGRVTDTLRHGEDAAFGMRPPLDAVRVRLPRSLLDVSPSGVARPPPGTDGGLNDHDRANVGRLGRALTSRRVGLALGGGGALGYVHATLIEALRADNVPIDVITGTSFGAVVGAYWSVLAEPGGERAEREALHTLISDWPYPLAALSVGTISTVGVELWIDARLGRHRLDGLEITYVPVATSAWDGTQVPAIRGTVGDGVRASGSFPPYGPTIVGQERLLDGGIAANVPVYMCELAGADIVIASNAVAPPQSLAPGCHIHIPYLSQKLDEYNPYQRLVDVVRANLILLRNANQSQGLSADVVYDSEVHGFNPMEFFKARDIAAAARNAPGFSAAIGQAVVAFRLLEQDSTPRVSLGADGRFDHPEIRWQELFQPEGDLAVIAPASDGILRQVASMVNDQKDLRPLKVHVSAPDLTRGRPGASAEVRAEAIGMRLLHHGVAPERLEVSSEGGPPAPGRDVEVVIKLG